MKRENLTLIIHILITLMSSSAQLENAKLAHKVSLEIKRLNAYSNTNTKLALRARTQVLDVVVTARHASWTAIVRMI